MADSDLLAAQKELLSSAYSQAQAYTNVVLVAGYAGFFGIWTQMANEITKPTKFWAGLLICLSIGGFIAWEIYGMIARSKSLIGISRAVNEPERFAELILSHRINEQERMIKFGQVWRVALVFVAGTGFTALGIMLSAFTHGLWLAYHAP